MKTYCVNYKKYATKKISSVRKTKKMQIKAFIKLYYLWQKNQLL